MKTLNYTQRFSKFKNRETIAAIRRWHLMFVSPFQFNLTATGVLLLVCLCRRNYINLNWLLWLICVLTLLRNPNLSFQGILHALTTYRCLKLNCQKLLTKISVILIMLLFDHRIWMLILDILFFMFESLVLKDVLKTMSFAKFWMISTRREVSSIKSAAALSGMAKLMQIFTILWNTICLTSFSSVSSLRKIF